MRQFTIFFTLSLACIPAWSQGRPPIIEVKPLEGPVRVPQGESPTGLLLARLSRTELRQPTSQWESAHLEAAATSIRRALSILPGELIGIATLPDAAGDVFAAEWKVEGNEPVVTKVAAWDTPEYAFLVLRCKAESFATPQAAQEFLQRLIASKIPYPHMASVLARHGEMPNGTILGGTGFLVYSGEYGGEYEIVARRLNGGVALVFKIGKFVLSAYPEGSAYVPERFPPLKDRLAEWSRSEVIGEIGKTLRAEGPIKAFANRDKILFGEALSRGLSAEELRRLFVPAGPPQFFWGRRVDAFLAVLVERQQVSRYRDVLAELALQYGQMPVEGRGAADAIFRRLARTNEVDLSKEAIECISRCNWRDGAFAYLELQATQESIKLLEETSVPEQLQSRKAATVERMRSRLKVEKR